MNIQGMISVVVGGTATSFFMNDFALRYFELPINAIIAIVCGALLGVAMGKRIPERNKLYITASGSIFIGGCLVILLPHCPGFGWTKELPQGAFGGVAAFVCRWLIPAFIDRFPQLFDRVTGTTPKKGDEP